MPRPPRSRLHRVYYLLAAFDLVTVSLSLWLIATIVESYGQSVSTNRAWADRIAAHVDLAQLASRANAPGNDLFESGNVEEMRRQHGEAVREYREREADIRADLEASAPGDRRRDLLQTLDQASVAMGEMGEEARRVFETYRGGSEAAARHMAQMDRAYARVGAALGALTRQVQSIQSALLQAQTERTTSLRRFEFAIAALIVVMVAALTIYGHKLSVRMREDTDENERHMAALAESERELDRHRRDLELLVEERTHALARSHEQLRTAERFASIGTLAAGLGHDMNNVLFPVRCRLDAMRAREDLAQVAGEIEAVRHSIGYLQQLSDGLRLMALDPDDPETTAGETTLHKWWDEVRPLVLTALPRMATLEGDIPADLPSVALAPHRLTQAMFNLVVNAGEAIDEAGSVRVWARPASAGRVRLGVTDTGTGMTDEVRRQAFDPFFTTKKRGLSTGLGLALVHGVAQAAGGTVEIDTELGRGTSIVMTLPAVESDAPAPVEGEVACVALADRRIATLLATLLRNTGFEVTMTTRGGAPEQATLWVTQVGDDALADARRFVAGGGRILGVRTQFIEYDSEWTELACLVDATAGIVAMHAAIRDVTK